MTQEHKLEYNLDFKSKLALAYGSDPEFKEISFRHTIQTMNYNILADINDHIDKFSRSNKGSTEFDIGWRHMFSNEKSYIDFLNLVMEEVIKRLPNDIRASFNRQQSIKLEKIIPPGPDDLIRLA